MGDVSIRALLAILLLQGAAVPTFDSNRAWEHLRQLVALGPRPAGSPAIERSRAYIKAQLTAAGVAVAEQAWDDETPVGKVRMVNLVATLPGTSKERLVIAGQGALAHQLVETLCPLIRPARFTAPGIEPKVVHHVAAAHDQDSLAAQRRERAAQLVVKRRGLGGIDAQLHDRHVGLIVVFCG